MSRRCPVKQMFITLTMHINNPLHTKRPIHNSSLLSLLRHKLPITRLPNPSHPHKLLPHNLQPPRIRPSNLPPPLPHRQTHNLPPLFTILLQKSLIHNLQKCSHHARLNLAATGVAKNPRGPFPGVEGGVRMGGGG